MIISGIKSKSCKRVSSFKKLPRSACSHAPRRTATTGPPHRVAVCLLSRSSAVSFSVGAPHGDQRRAHGTRHAPQDMRTSTTSTKDTDTENRRIRSQIHHAPPCPSLVHLPHTPPQHRERHMACHRCCDAAAATATSILLMLLLPRRACLARLEDQDGLRPQVKVDEVLRRVHHVRAVVRADHHVPGRAARGKKKGGRAAVSGGCGGGGEAARKKNRGRSCGRRALTCTSCRTPS